MNRDVSYGTGHRFRKDTLLERAVAVVRPPLRRFPALRVTLSRAVDAALWAGTAGRGFRAVLPHGEVVRLTPHCRGMVWNLEEYEAFRQATAPGDIVIDAGANTGAYTVLFAQWVGPGGHVYAFEPVPSIARELRRQIALNDVHDRVTVVEAALSDGARSIAMAAPGTIGINRRATAAEASSQTLTVTAASLDDFCRASRVVPTVIKIDVEGAELDVLRGARRVLAGPPRPRAFVELHPSLWPAYGMSADAVHDELRHQLMRPEALRAGDDVWRVEGICARLVPE